LGSAGILSCRLAVEDGRTDEDQRLMRSSIRRPYTVADPGRFGDEGRRQSFPSPFLHFPFPSNLPFPPLWVERSNSPLHSRSSCCW